MIQNKHWKTAARRGKPRHSGNPRGANLARRFCLERLEPRVVLAADPFISEFQAINQSTIQDADGDFSDWIEVRNPDSQPIDLDGWYLTDDAADLTKWQFPAVSIAANDQILVFASGKNRSDPKNELHTGFRLSGAWCMVHQFSSR